MSKDSDKIVEAELSISLYETKKFWTSKDTVTNKIPKDEDIELFKIDENPPKIMKDYIVFCVDITSKGSKKWGTSSVEALIMLIWKYYNNNICLAIHEYFEESDDVPVKFFLDLDGIDHETGWKKEDLENISKAVCQILPVYFGKYYTDCDVKAFYKVLIGESCSFPEKFSIHLLIPYGANFKNMNKLKAVISHFVKWLAIADEHNNLKNHFFFKNKKGLKRCIVDTQVYKSGGSLRTFWASKIPIFGEQPRPLRLYHISVDENTYLNREVWLKDRLEHGQIDDLAEFDRYCMDYFLKAIGNMDYNEFVVHLFKSSLVQHTINSSNVIEPISSTTKRSTPEKQTEPIFETSSDSKKRKNEIGNSNYDQINTKIDNDLLGTPEFKESILTMISKVFYKSMWKGEIKFEILNDAIRINIDNNYCPIKGGDDAHDHPQFHMYIKSSSGKLLMIPDCYSSHCKNDKKTINSLSKTLYKHANFEKIVGLFTANNVFIHHHSPNTSTEKQSNTHYFKAVANDEIQDNYGDLTADVNVEIPTSLLKTSYQPPSKIELEPIVIYGECPDSGEHHQITFNPNVDSDEKIETCVKFIKSHLNFSAAALSNNQIPSNLISKINSQVPIIASAAIKVWSHNVDYIGDSYRIFDSKRKLVREFDFDSTDVIRDYITCALFLLWTLESRNFFWFLCLCHHRALTYSKFDAYFVKLIKQNTVKTTTRFYDNKHLIPIIDGKCVNFRDLFVRSMERNDGFKFDTLLKPDLMFLQTVKEGLSSVDPLIRSQTNDYINQELEECISIFSACFPEPEACKYVLVSLGYALTGYKDEKTIFFWNGSNDQGKSTLLEIVEELMGNMAKRTSPNTLVEKKENNSSFNPELVSLSGKRLVLIPEVARSIVWGPSITRTFVGEGKAEGRKFQKDPIDVELAAKLFAAGNHLPNLQHADSSLLTKFAIVEFKISFVDNDILKINQLKRNPELIDRIKNGDLKAKMSSLLILCGHLYVKNYIGKLSTLLPERFKLAKDLGLERKESFTLFTELFLTRQHLPNSITDPKNSLSLDEIIDEYHPWHDAFYSTFTMKKLTRDDILHLLSTDTKTTHVMTTLKGKPIAHRFLPLNFKKRFTSPDTEVGVEDFNLKRELFRFEF